jgi:hypothetical protein
MNRSIGFVILLLALVGCSSPAQPRVSPMPAVTKPSVIISTPVSGASFTAGTLVAVLSASTDAVGIVRVDLLVDDQIVRSDPVPTGKSQPQLQITQTWQATTPGTHIVVVRATNEAGATGEAALSLTITEPPKPTNTPVPTVTPAPTRAPAPTPAPSASPHTLTLTEAQVSAIINAAIASGEIEYVSNASVSLQNGQIAITASYTPPGLKPISGKIVMTVSAINCALRVTVIQASLGVFTLNDAQKAALGQSIEQALKRQLPQSQTYCVDSVAVANSTLTIKYH